LHDLFLSQPIMVPANLFTDRTLFDRLADLELKRGLRYQSFVALLLIKPYADEGAPIQEIAIRLAELIQKQIRDTDLVGNYDANVLSILLLNSDNTIAQNVARRLSALMSQYFGAVFNQIQFNIGGACFPLNATDLRSLYHQATGMLSQAKATNRSFFLE